MNDKIALLGIVEILSSLSCGIVILYVTYRIMRKYGKKKLGIDHNNLAYNVLTAGVLFSVGYIVSGVIQPILNAFRTLSGTSISNMELVWQFIAYGGLYIFIAYISALIVTFLGIAIYGNMTSVSEIKELKNDNVGVAIVLTAIIVTLSLMCGDGIQLLVESFIPYPELPARIG